MQSFLLKKRGPILKDFRDEKHYYESSLNFMGNGEGFIDAVLGSTKCMSYLARIKQKKMNANENKDENVCS